MVVTALSGVGWAVYMVISRHYLKDGRVDVVELTTYSMGSGSLMLLGTTAITGNITLPSLNVWIIILWLSAVNTALAFALWNHALRALRAYEQSILQNTMLIQITLLAYTLLGEALTTSNIVGIAAVFIGVLIVQLASRH